MSDDVTSPAESVEAPKPRRGRPRSVSVPKADPLPVAGLVMNRGGASRQILAVGDAPRSKSDHTIGVAPEAP